MIVGDMAGLGGECMLYFVSTASAALTMCCVHLFIPDGGDAGLSISWPQIKEATADDMFLQNEGNM